MHFNRRKEKNREQVRFWAKPETYSEFKAECEKQGLFLQDAFNDFMHWFIANSKSGDIKIIDIKENV